MKNRDAPYFLKNETSSIIRSVPIILFGQLVGIVGNGDLFICGNDEDFDVAVPGANLRLFSYRGLLGNRPFAA